MLKHKYTFLLFVIQFIFSYAQVVSDKNISSEGASPSFIIEGDGTIHFTYSYPFVEVYYNKLDSLLNPVSNKISIDNKDRPISPSIDLNSNYVGISWVDYIDDYNYNLSGKVFKQDQNPTLDSTVFFSDNNITNIYRMEPTLCFLNDTLLLVTWWGESPDYPEKSGIFGRLMSLNSGLIGNELYLSSDLNRNSFDIKTQSSDLSSDFLSVWISDPPPKRDVYGRFFDSSGTPKDSSFLISDNKVSIGMDNLTMNMNNKGEFLVAWTAIDSSGNQIFYRWYNPNGEALSEVLTLKDGPIYTSSIDCHLTDEGKSIIVWVDISGTYYQLYAQRFNVDHTPLGDAFQISAQDRNAHKMFPCIALYNHKIYTFWEEAGNNIWANVLDFNNPVVSIDDNIIPMQFTLYQNYPNPFNPTSTISYDLPEAQDIKLQVFDITGRLVETLIDGFKEAGHWEHTWNASMQSSGIYIYRLTYGNRSVSMKMVVLK